MRNTLIGKILLLHKIMAIIQTPQVGNQSAYPKILKFLNYKSHIKHKKRTCDIANHFIDRHGGDHSALKFMLIDQHHENVRQRENFWIGTLITNLRGLNNSHDFVQQ